MSKNIEYGPSDQDWQIKTNLISDLAKTDDNYGCLVKIGGAISKNERFSLKQQSNLKESLNESGILTYCDYFETAFNRDEVENDSVDYSRYNTESNMPLQLFAIRAVYEFIEKDLSTEDKVAWLCGLFNKSHIDAPNFDSSDYKEIPFLRSHDNFVKYEENIFNDRVNLSNDLLSRKIINSDQLFFLTESTLEEFRSNVGHSELMVYSFFNNIENSKDPKFIFEEFQKVICLGYEMACRDSVKADEVWDTFF